MVERVAARLRRLDEYLEVFARRLLAGEIGERQRADRRIVAVVVAFFRAYQTSGRRGQGEKLQGFERRRISHFARAYVKKLDRRSREMSGAKSHYEYMSLDDFEELLADKPTDEKWELIGGRVVRMMVGARWEHKRIVQNVTFAFMSEFRRRGSDCRPWDETFWLKQRLLDLACFPDVMVRCGPLPPGAISLDDPIVLIEVVSKGSAQRDRLEKWALYRRLPSLRHYVLIERDVAAVDLFDRSEENFIQKPRLTGLHDVLRLPAIDFEMPLAEIYRDVIDA